MKSHERSILIMFFNRIRGQYKQTYPLLVSVAELDGTTIVIDWFVNGMREGILIELSIYTAILFATCYPLYRWRREDIYVIFM